MGLKREQEQQKRQVNANDLICWALMESPQGDPVEGTGVVG
jgi:hypothetical protein